MDLPVEPWVLALLMLAAFIAAFVDSIVGGGGVIALPALLIAGIPPHLALGTNKLAATGASGMATLRYTGRGYVELALVLRLIPVAVAGSFLGAAAVLLVDPGFIRVLVMVVMVGMTLYVVFRPKLGHDNAYPGLEPKMFALATGLVAAIGFYDGFLGPGAGSLLLFMFLGVTKFDFLRAAANGRVLNFATNAGALILFALEGQIIYEVGVPMLGAMLAGAYVGSHYGMKHGATWVKPLFVVVTLAILARLAFF